MDGSRGRNKALLEDYTTCNICFEPYDAESCGKRAPITSPCCGQSACRGCIDTFHAVKQEATSRVKYFPCLFCNTEKAFHIDKLPTPHHGFIALISMCRLLELDNSQQFAALNKQLATATSEASTLAVERKVANESVAHLQEKLSAREKLLIQQSEMHVRSLEDARVEIDGFNKKIPVLEERLRALEHENDCLRIKDAAVGTKLKHQLTADQDAASELSQLHESAEQSCLNSTTTQLDFSNVAYSTRKEPGSPLPPSHLIEDPSISPGTSVKKSAEDESRIQPIKRHESTKKSSKRAVVRSETSFLLNNDTIPAEKFFAFSYPTNSVCIGDMVRMRPKDVYIASNASRHKSSCHMIYLRSSKSECVIGEYVNIDGDGLGSGDRPRKRACLDDSEPCSLAPCSDPATVPNSEPVLEEPPDDCSDFALNLSRLMMSLKEVCADRVEEIYDLHFSGTFAPFSSYRLPGEPLEPFLQRFVATSDCHLETRNSTLILVSSCNDLDVAQKSTAIPQEVVAIENDACSERSSSEVPIWERLGSSVHNELKDDEYKKGNCGLPIWQRLGSSVQNDQEDGELESESGDGGVPVWERLGSSIQNEVNLANDEDEEESESVNEEEFVTGDVYEDDVVDRRIVVQNDTDSSTVFVCHIAPTCTELEFRDCFLQFMQDADGSEMDVRKHENRAFAHIDLRSQAAASMAISMSLNEGIFLGKSRLIVQPSRRPRKVAISSVVDHVDEENVSTWKSSKRCRFFDTKGGCRSGSKCEFKHD